MQPRRRISPLGAARDGTGHWWGQRLSAAALALASLAFLPGFAAAVGGGLEEVRAIYRQPFHAVAAMLFVAAALYHLRLGLQVVVEDYVSRPGPKAALLALNSLGCLLLGAVGVFAVARLALFPY